MRTTPEIIEIKRANDRTLKVSVKQDGVAVDVTGWTFLFRLKVDLDQTDDEAAVQKDIGAGDVGNDPENGIIYIPLTHNDTDIDYGNYFYDVKAIDSSNKIMSSQTKQLKIVDWVTRDEA